MSKKLLALTLIIAFIVSIASTSIVWAATFYPQINITSIHESTVQSNEAVIYVNAYPDQESVRVSVVGTAAFKARQQYLRLRASRDDDWHYTQPDYGYTTLYKNQSDYDNTVITKDFSIPWNIDISGGLPAYTYYMQIVDENYGGSSRLTNFSQVKVIVRVNRQNNQNDYTGYPQVNITKVNDSRIGYNEVEINVNTNYNQETVWVNVTGNAAFKARQQYLRLRASRNDESHYTQPEYSYTTLYKSQSENDDTIVTKDFSIPWKVDITEGLGKYIYYMQVVNDNYGGSSRITNYSQVKVIIWVNRQNTLPQDDNTRYPRVNISKIEDSSVRYDEAEIYVDALKNQETVSVDVSGTAAFRAAQQYLRLRASKDDSGHYNSTDSYAIISKNQDYYNNSVVTKDFSLPWKIDIRDGLGTNSYTHTYYLQVVDSNYSGSERLSDFPQVKVTVKVYRTDTLPQDDEEDEDDRDDGNGGPAAPAIASKYLKELKKEGAIPHKFKKGRIISMVAHQMGDGASFPADFKYEDGRIKKVDNTTWLEKGDEEYKQAVRDFVDLIIDKYKGLFEDNKKYKDLNKKYDSEDEDDDDDDDNGKGKGWKDKENKEKGKKK